MIELNKPVRKTLALVGLAGKAGSGKDTVGEWLIDNKDFIKVSFAQPLYDGLAAMGFPAPATREQKEALIPGFNFSWREAAQKLGTEWGRGLQSDIWMRIAEQRFTTSNKKVVITDVRFENEASMIRRQGGIVFHVGGRQSELGDRSGHVSEMPVMFHPNEDHILNNSSTIDQLHKNLLEIFG